MLTFYPDGRGIRQHLREVLGEREALSLLDKVTRWLGWR